tara:strand:- start:98 stop:1132 length:1035 start_codon:yes stop_codon:yes gene_type:complete
MGDTPYDEWFKTKLQDLEAGINLISQCGKTEFFTISSKIYGLPKGKLRDGKTTPLDLAISFSSIMENYKNSPRIRNNEILSADELSKVMKKKVRSIFGDESPEVLVVDNISAKATASSKRIKLRKGANFTHKDVDQLFNHEALVHVATSLNGKAQEKIKLLGANYGSITKTQEGLAVFSEFITGCIDIERMNRISDRVTAIQMAIDGASFVDVFRYFRNRTRLKTDAFENTRRVFRGGVVSGGAPFTKDIVYLDGMIRVHNFFRAAVNNGKLDALEMLFAGKIDLDDIPIVLKMKSEGLINKPKYLPFWLKDIDLLVSYFSFSGFISSMEIGPTDNYYEQLFKL